MWGLVCELIVIIYYVMRNYFPVEFYMVLGLLVITLGALIHIIVTIRKEVVEELKEVHKVE